jgi:hypothetical protein
VQKKRKEGTGRKRITMRVRKRTMKKRGEEEGWKEEKYEKGN